MWWNGPKWLAHEKDKWSIANTPIQNISELPEQRTIQLALLIISPLKDIVSRYSTWHRLLRGVAWILRFIKYIRSGRQIQASNYLSIQDLKDAEHVLLRIAQKEDFGNEIMALNKQKEIGHNSKLKALNPLMKNKLIVVGGRLENADISEEQKRPIILPANHRITRLIFMHRHRNLLHCGPQALLADIRRCY